MSVHPLLSGLERKVTGGGELFSNARQRGTHAFQQGVEPEPVYTANKGAVAASPAADRDRTPVTALPASGSLSRVRCRGPVAGLP